MFEKCLPRSHFKYTPENSHYLVLKDLKLKTLNRKLLNVLCPEYSKILVFYHKIFLGQIVRIHLKFIIKISFPQNVKEWSIYLTIEISKISGLWNNITKHKILTIFHLQHFFKVLFSVNMSPDFFLYLRSQDTKVLVKCPDGLKA